MPAVDIKVYDYIRQQLKLADIPEVVSDSYLDSAMALGGSQFWRNEWYFARRVKQFALTAGTCEYSADDNLEKDIEGIIAIRRLSSSDRGKALKEKTPDDFDHRHPYPTSETSGKPRIYKVFVKDGKLYFSVYPAPDSNYTVEVTYKLGWNKSRLALIPDNFVDVYMQSCLEFAVPVTMKFEQHNIYVAARDDALQNNTPSKSEASVMKDAEEEYEDLPYNKANPYLD